jgi:hypothetical protein
VEDLRVRRPRNRPGRPSDDGGVELGAELCRSASSVEDGLLLVIGVLGGGIRRGLLRVLRVPRECLRCGLVAMEPGAHHLDDPNLGVRVVCHCCVLAEQRRRRLIKGAVGGKRNAGTRERPSPRVREAAGGKRHQRAPTWKRLTGSRRGGT